MPRRVIKGARTCVRRTTAFAINPQRGRGQAIDSSTTHLGFRCVRRTYP